MPCLQDVHALRRHGPAAHPNAAEPGIKHPWRPLPVLAAHAGQPWHLAARHLDAVRVECRGRAERQLDDPRHAQLSPARVRCEGREQTSDPPLDASQLGPELGRPHHAALSAHRPCVYASIPIRCSTASHSFAPAGMNRSSGHTELSRHRAPPAQIACLNASAWG